MKRRERTRRLIEIGGLVVKSGLVELTNDDRAALYGTFIELAFHLQSSSREQVIALWRHRGSLAFKEELNDREQRVLRPPRREPPPRIEDNS